MENLEKVELVREKCGVSYEEARKALEACGYEVLDAIIMLEREGKTAQEPEVVVEVAEAREEPKAEERSGYQESKATNAWNQFCKRCREFVNSGMDTTFVAERNGERVIALPVLVVIIGLFMWGASLWLLIIGMFFGFRYSLEGKGKLVNDLNDVMGKAADAADDIKESVA